MARIGFSPLALRHEVTEAQSARALVVGQALKVAKVGGVMGSGRVLGAAVKSKGWQVLGPSPARRRVVP